MRKLYILALLAILASCSTHRTISYVSMARFASPEVIKLIDEHVVSIAVYYMMGDLEYQRRITRRQTSSMWREGDMSLRFLEEIFPVKTTQVVNGVQQKAIAYIGSGAVMASEGREGSYVLTVNHLFEHGKNTTGMKIWVFLDGIDNVIGADIVAQSGDTVPSNDYAVLKLRETLDARPGLKITETEVIKGEKVIYAGSVGGTAFLSRYCYVTTFQDFFLKDAEGGLTLTRWEDFKFWCLYVSGGNGDSGGLVCKTDGTLTTVMYCGITIHGHNYTFANPLSMLIEFLETSDLAWIGK